MIKGSKDPCDCHQCRLDRDERNAANYAASAAPALGIRSMTMILCNECGNKRCPHATDHRHACTDSNEPDQQGSIYGDWELRLVPPPRVTVTGLGGFGRP